MKSALGSVLTDSFKKVQEAVNDPAQRDQIQNEAFESALHGITQGSMTYHNDPLSRILKSEVDQRISSFQGLSAKDEANLMKLTALQKSIIVQQDRASKAAFLSQAPAIGHAGVKAHPKFQSHAQGLAASAKADVAKA